jgi:transposase
VPQLECIERLGVWEGYRVAAVERLEAGPHRPRAEVWFELQPIEGRRLVCDGCGGVVSAIHDTAERHVRDLPVFDAEAHLRVQRCRVLCPRCGPKLERLSWLDRYARVTRRLAHSIVRMCQVLPVKHVASFYGLAWDTVKDLDKAALERTVGAPDLEGLEVIAMDEFAIQRGHRYATVVVEPRRRRVLWVGRGHDRDSVRAFFELLGPQRCEQLRAVAMDMSASYALEVQAHCPNAEIVYDLFHVVAKYGREVIDRVRVDEANRLRSDKRARRVVKGSRWLLLRNRENLARPEDRVRLRELLEANRALLKVYLLRDDLKRLWEYRYRAVAERFWDGWYQRAVRSRIRPLVRFAKNLLAFRDGILAHCRWPLHTSVLEGINNKIKVIKRMAYGFRDDAYFFLKIRAAFPGKAG